MDVLEGEEAKHVADGEGPLRRRAPSCGITGICGATIAPGSVEAGFMNYIKTRRVTRASRVLGRKRGLGFIIEEAGSQVC